MRLSNDRTRLTYDRFLILDGIPPEAFNAKVITVSLETVGIVAGLPGLGIDKADPVVDATGLS